MADDPHAQHHAPGSNAYKVSQTLGLLALGGGALMLAPHVLPAMGLGGEATIAASESLLHGTATGLAGGINAALSHVPVIGGHMAEGGLFNAMLAGGIGVGGVLIGSKIAKKEAGKQGIQWGRVIEYAALATSALIALPTVLSSISAGIMYLSQLLGQAAGNLHFPPQMASLLKNTLGTTGLSHAHMGFTGLAAIIPHLLTCGVAMVPAALAFWVEDEAPRAPARYTDGSVQAAIEVGAPPAMGRPCNARLKLTHTATGLPVTPDELAVVHEEKLHLFVVDGSLKDYRHIHPKPTGEPGTYAFSFTPASPGGYSAWADFTMLKDGQNHKLKTDIPAPSPSLPTNIRPSSRAEKNGLSFEWMNGAPLREGEDAMVSIMVRDEKGKPVADLEPVMGAYAHLVGFGADGTSIIHTHPIEGATAPGMLQFHVEPMSAQPTQFYLQVRRGGEDIYVPFGQQILPARGVPAQPQHAGHSPGMGM